MSAPKRRKAGRPRREIMPLEERLWRVDVSVMGASDRLRDSAYLANPKDAVIISGVLDQAHRELKDARRHLRRYQNRKAVRL